MNENDRAFHDSMKPSWGPDGTLVYAVSSNAKPLTRSSRRARDKDGLLTIQKGGVVSESRDVRFAKFSNEVSQSFCIIGTVLINRQASADALKKHKALAIIDDSGDVPFATLRDQFSFSEFFDNSDSKNPAILHEKLVWQLAGILFDHIDVPAELQDVPNAIERLRKDKVSAFWKKLVDHASTQQATMIKSNEEKAIASLSGHRIADACGHLLSGKDFHLATLIAQIGGRDSMRKDIRQQLQEWHKSKVISEFSLPIRTLYEILAGNVCVCDGSKGGPVEDRVESYVISKRFGLDWRQAFGLRLWYGILAGDDITIAVQQFAEDLGQNKETSRPQTWYVEQKVPTLWEDNNLDDREDLLWGLLRLYTFQDADLEAIIRPENSQLSPLDTRLSWQLSRALTATGEVSYRDEANDKADQATLSFASQLTNEGSWLDAVFVLLHISSEEARAKSIQEHLAHHAGRIGTEESHSFTTLANAFKIPTAWIWEAKALYMRSVKSDPRGEVDCLIKAGLSEEAHRTFTKEVAPKSVIERDYGTLQKILDGLDENVIPEWHLGGEIYQDFLDLLAAQKGGEQVDYAVIDRLLAGLPAAVEDSRHAGFMETVAVEIMSAVVAKAVAAMAQNGDVSLLPHPNTEQY
jgi:nuclear pore complex protein Nup98-Nup96